MNNVSEKIQLDFRSQEAIFLQIVRQIENLVQVGILKPGDQLPTVRQMAIDLRINFSTVARAYHVLDEQRLISTQRGRGTYIWDTKDLEQQHTENQPFDAEGSGRAEDAAQIARDFIEEAVRKGFTLGEIKLAFDREMGCRMESAAGKPGGK